MTSSPSSEKSLNSPLGNPSLYFTSETTTLEYLLYFVFFTHPSAGSSSDNKILFPFIYLYSKGPSLLSQPVKSRFKINTRNNSNWC